MKAPGKKSGSYGTSGSVILTRHAISGWRQQLITARILFVLILQAPLIPPLALTLNVGLFIPTTLRNPDDDALRKALRSVDKALRFLLAR
ncbi:hypothetical protein I5080_01285 [Salmonella enterica]|nr:hypothetical protein I5080_01285 [Salmonella enterica]